MKVLVVGGAGYVGGAVTDILAQPHYTDGQNFAGATEHQFCVYDSLLYEDSYRKPVSFFLLSATFATVSVFSLISFGPMQ